MPGRFAGRQGKCLVVAGGKGCRGTLVGVFESEPRGRSTAATVSETGVCASMDSLSALACAANSTMTTTMKALRKMQPARGLSFETAKVPAIGPTDVLVRVRTASICGTDLHIYGWDRWSQGRIKPPVTLGHEFCGVVESFGDEVTAVKAGDFVSAEMHVNCGHCRQCRIGEAHVCQNLTIIATETNAERRAMAKKMGAEVVINPAEEDTVKRILGETDGTGVDVLLEMSGNPTAIQQGFKALRAGGRASLLGIPTEAVSLDLVNDVIFKGATVQGIYGRRMYGTWVQMTALLKAGRLNLEPLFGERAALDGFEGAFAKLQGGLPGKILLYPDGVK